MSNELKSSNSSEIEVNNGPDIRKGKTIITSRITGHANEGVTENIDESATSENTSNATGEHLERSFAKILTPEAKLANATGLSIEEVIKFLRKLGPEARKTLSFEKAVELVKDQQIEQKAIAAANELKLQPTASKSVIGKFTGIAVADLETKRSENHSFVANLAAERKNVPALGFSKAA